MASKIALYNSALRKLGQERLADLTEASASRYALDDAYDEVLTFCLEQSFWNFAMRAIQADSSSSVEPTFGYTYAFAKPSDFVRLYGMSGEETMQSPLMNFVDEPNYWYANCDPVYVKYVSNDNAYGRDLSLWSATFTEYVAIRLANETCKRITGSMPDESMERKEKRAKADAASKDAMNEPVGFPPSGSWVNSRGGNCSTSRWDRNS